MAKILYTLTEEDLKDLIAEAIINLYKEQVYVKEEDIILSSDDNGTVSAVIEVTD